MIVHWIKNVDKINVWISVKELYVQLILVVLMANAGNCVRMSVALQEQNAVMVSVWLSSLQQLAQQSHAHMGGHVLMDSALGPLPIAKKMLTVKNTSFV